MKNYTKLDILWASRKQRIRRIGRALRAFLRALIVMFIISFLAASLFRAEKGTEIEFDTFVHTFAFMHHRQVLRPTIPALVLLAPPILAVTYYLCSYFYDSISYLKGDYSRVKMAVLGIVGFCSSAIIIFFLLFTLLLLAPIGGWIGSVLIPNNATEGWAPIGTVIVVGILYEYVGGIVFSPINPLRLGEQAVIENNPDGTHLLVFRLWINTPLDEYLYDVSYTIDFLNKENARFADTIENMIRFSSHHSQRRGFVKIPLSFTKQGEYLDSSSPNGNRHVTVKEAIERFSGEAKNCDSIRVRVSATTADGHTMFSSRHYDKIYDGYSFAYVRGQDEGGWRTLNVENFDVISGNVTPALDMTYSQRIVCGCRRILPSNPIDYYSDCIYSAVRNAFFRIIHH